MFRYTPAYILDRFAKGSYQGLLRGYVLLLDVAGFSFISSLLEKEGNRGAEELSRLLQLALKAQIHIIQDHGGFVSQISGDTMCAIFPQAQPELMLWVVNSIRKQQSHKSRFHSSFGKFHIKFRQSVAYGDVSWEIFVNDHQCEYVFYGDVMKELMTLASQKKEILFSSSAAQSIGFGYFEPYGLAYFPTSDVQAAAKSPLLFDYPQELKSRFTHPKYVDLDISNEIRNAAFCAVLLERIPQNHREQAVLQIQILADRHGGFVSKYSETEKGLTCIIIFGFPTSGAKILEQASNFALEAVKDLSDLCIGLSCGKVFSGFLGCDDFKEYMVLGQAPHLALRLLSEAQPGQIIADNILVQELHSKYEFAAMGKLVIFGAKHPIGYYLLQNRIENGFLHKERKFVCRDKELSSLRTLILKSQQNSVFYINGEAGVGKSRLAREILSTYTDSSYQIFMVSCDALLNKPLDAIKQILKEVFDFNPKHSHEEGMKHFRNQWKQYAANDVMMQLLESVLASLLGYEWDKSFWSTLSMEKKQHHLKLGFSSLMLQLAKKKAVIIYIDDVQWLDESSKSFFKQIQKNERHPIVFLCTSRYLSDGKKMDLELENGCRYDLDLDSFDYAQTRAFIKEILEKDSIPEPTQELIFKKTMGNPLFIEQLSSYLMENRYLDNEGVLQVDLGYLSNYGVNDVISSRLERLSEQERVCVENASVLGFELDVKTLEAMIGHDINDELEAGEQKRIWHQLTQHRYIFCHVVIKEAVYQRISSSKLQLMHQNAAKAMIRLHTGNVQEKSHEIATHFEKAGALNEAAKYYDAAGSYYWSKFMLQAAKESYQKAIKLWEASEGKNSSLFAESVFHLAILRHYLKDFEQLDLLYKQVIQINESNYGTDSKLLSPYYNNLGRYYKDIGRYHEAEELLKRSLDIEISIDANSTNVTDRLNNIGHLYQNKKDFEKARSCFEQALHILEQHHDADYWFTSIVLSNLGFVNTQHKQYEKAELLFNRALEIQHKKYGNSHPTIANSNRGLAQVYLGKRKFRKAETHLLKALEISEDTLGKTHDSTIKTQEALKSLHLKSRKKTRIKA